MHFYKRPDSCPAVVAQLGRPNPVSPVLASDYTRMAAMRAMHKSVRCVYSASPWNAENTMRALYAIAHH